MRKLPLKKSTIKTERELRRHYFVFGIHLRVMHDEGKKKKERVEKEY